MIIPNFQDGVLPIGDYEVTFEELRESILVNGCGELRTHWDIGRRNYLVDNLEKMVTQLWNVGIINIFIDGSFVEEKVCPNDIDGYFECDLKYLASGDLQRNLNLLDDKKIWVWDAETRKAYHGYPKKQLPMWHSYRVELYPYIPSLFNPTGIYDKDGNGLNFAQAFRLSRHNDRPKGIVKIMKSRSL